MRATLAVLASAAAVTARSAVTSPRLWRVRGGSLDEPSDALLQATFACNGLFASTLADAGAEITSLRAVIDAGDVHPNFGVKADAILADAMDKFTAETPAGDGDVSSLYAEKAEELKAALISRLEPAFVQQIALLRDGALEEFKKGMVRDGDGSEAAVAAEAAFVQDATASVPSGSEFSFKAQRTSLVSVMQTLSAQAKKVTTAKLQAGQQLQTAMSYLQMQQQQMQALQAQYSGGQGNKWNVGAAYRPPASNINLSAAYQQGRTNLQISMVPDEGAALLGPNGFTHGVGPANLGLSFNIHI